LVDKTLNLDFHSLSERIIFISVSYDVVHSLSTSLVSVRVCSSNTRIVTFLLDLLQYISNSLIKSISWSGPCLILKLLSICFWNLFRDSSINFHHRIRTNWSLSINPRSLIVILILHPNCYPEWNIINDLTVSNDQHSHHSILESYKSIAIFCT
jgi:hypothetical protein